MSLPKPYYEDEEHGIVIYNADCRDILPHLPKVDLLLTDPPYGIDFAGQPTNYQRLAGMKPKSWDKKAPVLTEWVQLAAHACIWGGNYFQLPPKRGWLAWYKRDSPESFGDLELAWTTCETVTRLFDWTISATNRERVGHPTQKPLALMLWCLGFFPKTQTVLDPFMGSGTTLVACKQLGRKCIGIEIDEKYCEIAARRLSQGMLFGQGELAQIGGGK